MRYDLLLATSTALVLLAVNGVFAGVPHLTVRREPARTTRLPQPGQTLLYDQTDADNPQAIVAQNFESSFDAYDCEAADDFTVPQGETWKIVEVHVEGTFFDGTGPANSFNVAFHREQGGKVGEVVRKCRNASFRPGSQFDVGAEYITCKVKLTQGSYFVAVQANMNFRDGSEWGWITNNTVRGSASMWRNRGGGFGVDCLRFKPTTFCIPNGEGGDYSFALYGRSSGEF